MIRIVAVLVAAVFSGLAQKPLVAAKPINLIDRFELPPGYGSEQDVESDGSRSFSTAAGVSGHILRRYVQAGDDKTSVADLAAYFADRIHEQGGSLFDDRLNNISGQLDGRVPGAKPVWLHVEISDEGGVIDVILLEERAPVAREMPVEETRIPGTWTAAAGTTSIAEKIAPLLQPYQGWEWRLVLDEATRARLSGLARSQACASCPIVTDTREITVATFDLRSGRPVVDIPSRHAAADASLYQQQLIAKIVGAFGSTGARNELAQRR